MILMGIHILQSIIPSSLAEQMKDTNFLCRGMIVLQLCPMPSTGVPLQVAIKMEENLAQGILPTEAMHWIQQLEQLVWHVQKYIVQVSTEIIEELPTKR